MVATQRYWDGQQWGEQVAPLQPGPVPVRVIPERESMSGGYVLAVILPSVGLIYGLVKINRGGGGVVAASIGAWIFWAVVFSAVAGA
jgi:hypothetical protein